MAAEAETISDNELMQRDAAVQLNAAVVRKLLMIN